MERPEYVKVKLPTGDSFYNLSNLIRGNSLHTVCEEARCPNISECWESGTATFMILGKNCSRGCRFCSVTHGNMENLDPDEPAKVRDSVRNMNLKYAVITSVDRDDLPDQGSGHYSETIKQVKSLGIRVEALIPDFRGDKKLIDAIINSKPDVIAHNVETVRRLTPSIRDARAGYDQSLSVLSYIKDKNPDMITKSSIMLGHGETDEEVEQTMSDLIKSGVDILTIGQYLRPSKKQIEVKEYCSSERYKRLEAVGYEYGFRFVASGPLVRTSYRAFEAWAAQNIKLN
ncbi:MAG: lipoyl synthase [Candidatus Thermoplasmatota archaeon]|nr:lipoyl synthase [Candidatus Thermoplasmatota archaeon]MCL5888556.1 lipoyl synthase [Candidatus Thermoplasmatota archaeon]